MTSEHRVRIGDVLRLERRPAQIDPIASYNEIGIRSFGRGIFHKEPTSGTEFGSRRMFWIRPNDLVLSNVVAWEGAIALASPAENGRIGSHRLLTYVAIDDSIDTAWASWFLRSDQGLRLIGAASPGSTIRNRTLAIDRFEDIEIALPSRRTQRVVARRMDRVASSVADIEHSYARADELRHALSISLCTRSDLTVQARASQGWRSIMLGDVLQENTTKRPVRPSMSYRMAGVFSFGRGLIDRGHIKGEDTKYRTFNILREDDVVVSKLGAWEGGVAVVTRDFDGACASSEFPTFQIDRSRMLPRYLAGVVRSPRFWQAVDGATKGSMARRKRITPERFLQLEVELPPLEYQYAVVRQLQKLDEIATVQREKTHYLPNLLPAMLNAVFA